MQGFSINISILFTEAPFLDRFELAARAGFQAVEFWWPSEAAAEVAAAARDAGIEVVLFNFYAGDMSEGDRGLLSDPARTDAFRASLPIALDLAERTGCRQINALVGLRLPTLPLDEQLHLARTNVAYAADQYATLGGNILIEALNTFENGPYLLSNTEEALRFARSVGRSNIKLQYDAYHMQRMEGNLKETIAAHLTDIGHIQLADCPSRNEPGTGEINFDYLLKEIEGLGYDGFIGLEYRPSGNSTEQSLAWLPRHARAQAREAT